MGLLAAMTGWKGYAAAALVGGVVLGAATWTAQGWRYGAQIAQQQRDDAQAKVKAVEAARTEERRRTAVVEKARDDAQNQAKKAAAGAAAAVAARQRLQHRIAGLLADATARNAALANGGPSEPGAAPIDLLAGVLDRAIDTAGQLAAYADQLRVAGLTCEAAYDGVRLGEK